MIIFDLETTLVDTRGCTQLLGDWEEYGAKLNECGPYEPMEELFDRIRTSNSLLAVISSRPEKEEMAIRDWLEKHDIAPDFIFLKSTLATGPLAQQMKHCLQQAMERFERPEVLGKPWFLVTGSERTAEVARELGIQSLVVTPLVG